MFPTRIIGKGVWCFAAVYFCGVLVYSPYVPVCWFVLNKFNLKWMLICKFDIVNFFIHIVRETLKYFSFIVTVCKVFIWFMYAALPCPIDVVLPLLVVEPFNTLRPRQDGRYFADDVLKCIFLNENVWISLKIPLTFVPRRPINNIPALVQIMAWRRRGDKPLSEPMLIFVPTHICVTRPQWVNDILSHFETTVQNSMIKGVNLSSDYQKKYAVCSCTTHLWCVWH